MAGELIQYQTANWLAVAREITSKSKVTVLAKDKGGEQ